MNTRTNAGRIGEAIKFALTATHDQRRSRLYWKGIKAAFRLTMSQLIAVQMAVAP